jgi:hypothetical protein
MVFPPCESVDLFYMSISTANNEVLNMSYCRFRNYLRGDSRLGYDEKQFHRRGIGTDGVDFDCSVFVADSQ